MQTVTINNDFTFVESPTIRRYFMARQKFYEITEAKGRFIISKCAGRIATLECKELEQYGIALVALQENGKKNLYLPSKVDYNAYDYRKGIICVMEDVAEVLYYEKEDTDFTDTGILLVKKETDAKCGYWTVIDLYTFVCFLEPEVAEERLEVSKKIPYVCSTNAVVKKEFDYLPSQYMIEIDEVMYLVDVSRNMPLIRGLGRVKVEPLPQFLEYFKMISDREESFECFDADMSWGPFNKIEFEEIIYKSEFYVGKNQVGRICSIFYNRYTDDDSSDNDNEIGMFIFDEPVTSIKIAEVMDTDDGLLAVWKLLYNDNRKKRLYLCSINNTSSLQVVIDPSEYF